MAMSPASQVPGWIRFHLLVPKRRLSQLRGGDPYLVRTEFISSQVGEPKSLWGGKEVEQPSSQPEEVMGPSRNRSGRDPELMEAQGEPSLLGGSLCWIRLDKHPAPFRFFHPDAERAGLASSDSFPSSSEPPLGVVYFSTSFSGSLLSCAFPFWSPASPLAPAPQSGPSPFLASSHPLPPRRTQQFSHPSGFAVRQVEASKAAPVLFQAGSRFRTPRKNIRLPPPVHRASASEAEPLRTTKVTGH